MWEHVTLSTQWEAIFHTALYPDRRLENIIRSRWKGKPRTLFVVRLSAIAWGGRNQGNRNEFSILPSISLNNRELTVYLIDLLSRIKSDFFSKIHPFKKCNKILEVFPVFNFNPSDSKTKECQLNSYEQVLYSRLLVNEYLRDTKLILIYFLKIYEI